MPEDTLGPLTAGERLLIRRKRENWSQAQAAAFYGVTFSTYARWERDERGDPPQLNIGVLLKPHERCLLHRRRAGLEQAPVAQELGVSRFWLNKMERGKIPCELLLAYWKHKSSERK